MPTKSDESPPPMSDLVVKTRYQSLLDSPSRVTRGQLRRLSNVLPSDGTMSPLPSSPRRGRVLRAGNEEEESEATSPPRRGRPHRVQDEDTAPPSSPARRTRARRSVSGACEEPPKDTTSRRAANRLQSIVEDTPSVSTRRSSARTMSKHPSPEFQELPIPRRTRRSSVSSVTSVASSVASSTRRTRSQKKLSPVASPTDSEFDVVDIVSPEKCTASPSPSNQEMSTINETPVKSQSSPKQTSRALNADAQLSSGKKVGGVSPSGISPLKSPHSTSKNVSGTTPTKNSVDESDSPSVSEAGSEVFISLTAPQESKTPPGKVITESNSGRKSSEYNRLSSSRKSASAEKPKTPRKSFDQDEVSGLTVSEKLTTSESWTRRVTLPLFKTSVESSNSETCVEDQSPKVSPCSDHDVVSISGSSALSENKPNRSLSSRNSSSPGNKIPVASEIDGERNRQSSTCNISASSESSFEDSASVDRSVKDESNESFSDGIPSKSSTKSPAQDTCAKSGTIERFGKSTPNKTIDGKCSGKWLETSLKSNIYGKTPEKSPKWDGKTNAVESEESSGLHMAFQKSPYTDSVKVSPSKVSQAPKSFDGSEDETESSPDFSKLTESKSDESEDFCESDNEACETAVSPKLVPPQSDSFVKKTPGKSPSKVSSDDSVLLSEDDRKMLTISVEPSKETLIKNSGETGSENKIEEVVESPHEFSVSSLSPQNKSISLKTLSESEKSKAVCSKSLSEQQGIICVDYESDETIHLSDEEQNAKLSSIPSHNTKNVLVTEVASKPDLESSLGYDADSEFNCASSGLSKETPGMSTGTSSALKGFTPAKAPVKTPVKTPIKNIDTPGKSSASSTPKGSTPAKIPVDTDSATSATCYSPAVLGKPLNSHDADTESEKSIAHPDQATEVSEKNMVSSLKSTPVSKIVADSNDDSLNSSIQSGEMTEFVNAVSPRVSELLEYTSDESDEGTQELDKSVPLSGKKSSVGRLAKGFADIMSEEDENVPSGLSEEEPSDLEMILSSKRLKSLTPGKNSPDESLSHNSSQKISLHMDVSDIDSVIGGNHAGLSKSSVKSTNAGWSVSSKVMRDVANLLSQDFPSSDECSGDEQWSPVFTPSTKKKRELRAEKKQKRRAEKEARKNAKMTRTSKFQIGTNGEDLGETPEKSDKTTEEENGLQIPGKKFTDSSEDIGDVVPVELNKSFTAVDFDGLFSDEESMVKERVPKKTKAEKRAEKKLRKKQEKLSNLESTCLPIQHENVDIDNKCDKPQVERNVSVEVGEKLELDMKQKSGSALEDLKLATKNKKKKNKKKKLTIEGGGDLNLELGEKKKRHHSSVEIEETKPNKKQKKVCIDENVSGAVNKPLSSVINASKNKQKVEPEVDTKASKIKTKEKKKLKQEELSSLSEKKMLQNSMKPLYKEESMYSTESPLKKKKLEKHSNERELKKRKRENEMDSMAVESLTKKLKKRKREIEIDSMEAESMTKKLKKKEKKLKRAGMDHLEIGKLLKSSDTPVERNVEDFANGGSDSDEAPTSVSFSAGRQAALESLQAATANIRREEERKREKRRLKQRKLQEQKAERLQKLQEKLKKKHRALQAQETGGDSGASKSGFVKDSIPKRLPEDMLRALTVKSGAVGKRANEIGKETSVSAPSNKVQQHLEKVRSKKLARKLEKKTRKTLDYIPVEAGSSGATRFGVVPLRNIVMSTNKMAEDAVKFRKEMLFGSRVKRTPVTTILAHQEKLKAAGKDKFVRAS